MGMETTKEQSKELAPVKPVYTAPISEEEAAWNLIKKKAVVAMDSGLLPSHIKTPQQVAIIALKGKELGIPFMQSLQSISVINGKPVLASELMAALIYRKIPGAKIVYKETSADKCVIEATRPGEPPQDFTFTFDEAVKAGLTRNPTWERYRAAMLRARCISLMARAKFPDAIMGCYTPEEMGHEEPPDPPEPVQATLEAHG